MPRAWARIRQGGDLGTLSAGASHVASYLAHPELSADLSGGQPPVVAAVLSSGIYEMGDGPDHVYFGPAAGLVERSATAGLLKTPTALLVAGAELDPPGMVDQANALSAALAKAHRRAKRLVVAGHGHMTELYAVNSDDASVAAPVLAFLRGALR